tara:strand:- start:1581 stop:2090 length:510 start_codon:yes stop_codon:yes gene_type:complete
MAEKLGFKDFLTVDYAPGMDPIIKKNAKKRKGASATGANAEYASTISPDQNSKLETVDEALDMSQRLKRGRLMKRLKSRIAMGRKRQANRLADEPRLIRRARKAARNLVAKKFTQGIPKSELTFARRQEIEKRLDKMKGRIDKIAKRLLPKMRKADREKHSHAGKVEKN